MGEIILASASPRRSELLRQIGITFSIMPSNIDENLKEFNDANEFVQKLSYEKALNIAQKLKTDALVIGADTVVYKNGILGKPENKNKAFEMLMSLQGEWHEVITGITVIESKSMKSVIGYEKTRVKMRQMSHDTIQAYINTGEPMDKAGAYGIQGMGSVLIEKIEGCYFNVVGLPLMKLSKTLEEFGVRVL
jgi:septum formation protein